MIVNQYRETNGIAAAPGRCTMAAGPRERGARPARGRSWHGERNGERAVATIERERTAAGAGAAERSRARLLVRVWSRLAPALPAVFAVLYIGLWAITSLQNMNETDLDAFFLPSAQIALSGHPLHVYQTRFDLIYPNANGPLSLLPLTLVAWVAQRLGWLADPHLRRMLINAVFAVFPLLIGRELLLALDRLLPRPPAGVWRWLALGCVTLTPELWHSVLFYGHIEQPLMIWLVLAAVRMLADERPGRAGVYLGLALLDRSAAGLYLLALVLALVLRAGTHRAAGTGLAAGIRGIGRTPLLGAARMVGVAGVIAALGVLPFWLADPKDTVYSLVTFRGLLPVGGGSFWFVVAGTPWASLAQHDDGYAVMLAAGFISLVVLLVRRNLSVHSRDLYALLGLVGLCFPLLMKTLWPYYYLDSSIFFTFWWLASARDFVSWRDRLIWLSGITVPLVAVALAEVSETAYSSVLGYGWTVPWSLAMGALTLALLLAVGLIVLLRDDDPEPAHGTQHASADLGRIVV